jgi:hypothetical protein
MKGPIQMKRAGKLGWQIVGFLGYSLLLSACGSGQQKFEGTSVRVCPVGFAMEGVHVSDYIFTCVRVVPDAMDHQVHTRLDKGTEGNYGNGDMHVCPPGWYMRGLQNSKNWLVCSDGPVVEESFLDANGTTQAHSVHVCPEKDGRKTIMTGIHAGRDDFACAKFH